MFEVISLDNPGKWNETVRSMKEYDFYFLAEYHQLDNSGLPLLLHYQNGADSLAMPIVLRNIEGSDYKDITSVYGYCGPLTKLENPDPESIAGFQEELVRFFDANNIVSAFSRLHSLFPFQSDLLNGLGMVSDSNLTIGIDLTLPEKEQKKQYAYSLRYALNRLKSKKFSVRKAITNEEIDSFIEIYKETMDRVKASPNYYFSKEYFYRFLHSIDSFILLAFHEGQITAGSLCTTCNGIIQTHLNATKNEFLYLSPLKMVLDEVRSLGVRKGFRILHLGGGVSEDNDSLFFFKSRFSKQFYPFKIWKYIHNQEVYDFLVRQKTNETNESFFPLYRRTNG
jgi:hypothetical protein